ncbi:MAG: YicC/YloC family endoribonuclease, partial [Planctomycetota bacterium]
MLQSMTGYGEAEHSGEGFRLSLEIRSVNNRSLKIASKAPEEISFLQSHIEERIRARVQRGSVFATCRFAPIDSSDLYEIDTALIEKYLENAEELRTRLTGDGRLPKDTDPVAIRDLLLLPGVVRCEDVVVPEKDQVRALADEVAQEALDRLLEMRSREGKHLEDELRTRTASLDKLLQGITGEAPKAVEEYQQKLEQRVRTLLGDRESLLESDDL